MQIHDEKWLCICDNDRNRSRVSQNQKAEWPNSAVEYKIYSNSIQKPSGETKS